MRYVDEDGRTYRTKWLGLMLDGDERHVISNHDDAPLVIKVDGEVRRLTPTDGGDA